MPKRKTTTYGFARTGKLVQSRVRRASEGRGFAQIRVLTHWADIAGPELAACCRPIKINYGKPRHRADTDMRVTLTLLVQGAMAPMVEMQKDQLRARVNAIYGYEAITQIRLTQTAPVGFAEGQADFAPAPRKPAAPDPAIAARARDVVGDVGDQSLRQALERLAGNVISKSNAQA
ncbi:MAG: DUF721 domain-containing protein [Paracoccaceae bacterium]